MILFLEELPFEKRTLLYNLFFDNLFTNRNLLYHDFSRTGTVCKNRIEKIYSQTNFQEHKRGSFEVVMEKNYGILYVQRLDNANIIVASIKFGTQSIRNVRRFSRSEKKIAVARLFLIGKYNQHMDGTDLMNEVMNSDRTGIRGKCLM